MNVQIKDFYSAQELTDLQLKSLPTSVYRIREKAKREQWTSQERQGKGGGLEYAFSSLPQEVQKEIKAKTLRAMIPKPVRVSGDERAVAVIGQRDVVQFDNYQRKVADARMMMAMLVGQYQAQMCRTKAIKYVSQLSRENALPMADGVDYNKICESAIACKSKTLGVGIRKLTQWVVDADRCKNGIEVLALLAPHKQGRPELNSSKVEWMPYFLSVYRNPKGLCLKRAYEEFSFAYSKLVKDPNDIPSFGQVRHAFNKLPKIVQMRGRVTGSRFKQLKGYVRRNWNPEWVFANDVWVGDGHAMKIKVAHPIHGHDFMPEITIIMDAASRYIVGWSLALSESHLAVADALRHAMIHNGVPSVYYSDNGSGQSNDVMDNPLTGILPRIGIEHATGIPGNAQGRGIIERAMKEVPKRVEQRFDTYFGKEADSETVRKRLYAVKSYSDAKESGKDDSELTPIQKKGKELLPSWQELLDVIEEEVYRYNNFHIHSVIKSTPANKRAKLIEEMRSQDEDIVYLTAMEARDLFRPAFERTVERGRVRYENKFYGSEILESFDGEKVLVFVDIHDVESVIVRDKNGKYICDAHLDWKTCDAFPKNYIETARAKRQAGVKRRAQEKIDRIEAESRKIINAESRNLFNEMVIDAEWHEVADDTDDDDIIIYDYQANKRAV